MGPRERLIASVIVAVIAVAAMWFLLVAPERSKAANLLAQITTEQDALTAAQGQLAAGQQAHDAYRGEVHSLRTLTTAVPSSDQVPSLIHVINGLEANHHVNYTSTSFGALGGGGLPSFSLGFSFVANYVDLQDFLGAFERLTLTNGTSILANGRLVSVSSITLSPTTGGRVTAGVTMTAYQMGPLSTTLGAVAAPAAPAAVGVTGVTGVTTAVAATQ